MSFKQNDKVKVTTKNSMHEGQTGKIVRVYEDNQSILVRLEQGNVEGLTTGFFASELELVDERRETLIEMAESMNTARLLAGSRLDAKADAGLQTLYNGIGSVLVSTLLQVAEDDLAEVYGYILDGSTVREALAREVSDAAERAVAKETRRLAGG